MFITETGMFHSACRATWGNVVEWYGFKPKQHQTPVGEGMVDRSDRSSMLKHYITFDIYDLLLRTALKKVADAYATKIYALTVCDCVSFTADVAREVGLRVPLVNFTPYGFIQVLGFWNSYREKK